MSQTSDEATHEPFRKLYESSDSQWGNTSGPGSDAFYTTDYRGFLSKFIRLNSIKSVTDVGCGDWQFSRFIDFGGARYLGLDVVDSVIRRNLERYRTDSITFQKMPENAASIQPGDLLIMKDVLQHLPDERILHFKTTLFSKFKHCLLINSFRKLNTPQNVDIPAGSFRCLDLTQQPYNFSGTYLMEFGSPVWERVRVFLFKS